MSRFSKDRRRALGQLQDHRAPLVEQSANVRSTARTLYALSRRSRRAVKILPHAARTADSQAHAVADGFGIAFTRSASPARPAFLRDAASEFRAAVNSARGSAKSIYTGVCFHGWSLNTRATRMLR